MPSIARFKILWSILPGRAACNACWRVQMFLRAGQMAVLDKMRTELMHSSAVIVQRHLRGWMARRQYHRVRWAVFTIQVASLPSPLTSALLPSPEHTHSLEVVSRGDGVEAICYWSLA